MASRFLSEMIKRARKIDAEIMAKINEVREENECHSTLGSLFSPIFTGVVVNEGGDKSYWILGTECSEEEYNGGE